MLIKFKHYFDFTAQRGLIEKTKSGNTTGFIHGQ